MGALDREGIVQKASIVAPAVNKVADNAVTPGRRAFVVLREM
jgi:hypothetical protein